jgi:hypothetical protein
MKIDDVLAISDPDQKNIEVASLRQKLRAYNRSMFSSRSDQIFPVERPLDQRWFDELEFNPEAV